MPVAVMMVVMMMFAVVMMVVMLVLMLIVVVMMVFAIVVMVVMMLTVVMVVMLMLIVRMLHLIKVFCFHDCMFLKFFRKQKYGGVSATWLQSFGMHGIFFYIWLLPTVFFVKSDLHLHCVSSPVRVLAIKSSN